MYPSIIIAHNICVSTLTTVKPLKKDRHNYKEIQLDDGGERVWVHQEVKGVLPIILQNLWNERKRVKIEMKLVKKDSVEGRAANELMNAKQLGIKVSMNSIYGIFGASVGDMAFMALSRAVCAIGRNMIQDLVTSIHANHKDMEVVYGDSVSASTPIIVKCVDDINDVVLRCLSIECFWKEFILKEKYDKCLQVDYHTDKEAYHFVKDDVLSPPFQIYSDQGWTDIAKIIRHKPKVLRMFRVRTANGSQIEVTGDHSLLLKDGTCITPSKLKIGDILLTNNFEGMSFDTLEKKNFNGLPDFSKDTGENELHLFDLYHTQLIIQHLGPFFVEVLLSGQCFKVIYNCDKDPFFSAIDAGTVTRITPFNYDKTNWVYDLETANHHFSAGVGTLVKNIQHF